MRFKDWEAVRRAIIVIPGIGTIRAAAFIASMISNRATIRRLAEHGVVGAVELDGILPQRWKDPE